jgi:RND family efflux transporter MFP subunit
LKPDSFKVDSTEDQLRAEIDDLRRKLSEREHQQAHLHHAGPKKPSSGLLVFLAFLVVAVVVGAFFLGYLPHIQRQTSLVKDAKAENEEDLIVNVAKLTRSSQTTQLVLPGNIQAITEAPILARATGYLKQRLADIGDNVTQGQLLAEIEAPELMQQVQQANAALEQANAMMEQATANLTQGKANEQLAATTAERYRSLVQKGAVSKQENDNYQAQQEAQRANVGALEKAVSATRSSIGAAKANVARLTEMEGYRQVRAPFAGVITLRNVDTGALVNEGSTLLFRVAQTNRVRAYVNVPQSESTSVHVGLKAKLTIPDRPNIRFDGTVTHTSDSLDAASRTLLAEIQIDNKTGQLLPGMYSQVTFETPRHEPPLLIRADTLVVRADGAQVAVVTAAKTVHFQRIVLGRDLGDTLEVLSGLDADAELIINAGDRVQEGSKVRPVLLKAPAAAKGPGR